MAYDENLANKVREALIDQVSVEEKKMFGGLCFMVNDKMCICVRDKELLCRINPDTIDTELEKGNSREMSHGGKAMKGFLFVSEYGYQNNKDFKHLLDLCLSYNRVAKSSKK